MDWHDWMRNDKTMLGLLIVFVLILWAWVREPKLFDLYAKLSIMPSCR
jgi:hypothetical protein